MLTKKTPHSNSAHEILDLGDRLLKDLLYSPEGAHKVYERYQAETGYGQALLRQAVWISTRIGPTSPVRQIPEANYAMLRSVASLEPDDQLHWIRMAIAQKWSRKKLLDELRRAELLNVGLGRVSKCAQCGVSLAASSADEPKRLVLEIDEVRSTVCSRKCGIDVLEGVPPTQQEKEKRRLLPFSVTAALLKTRDWDWHAAYRAVCDWMGVAPSEQPQRILSQIRGARQLPTLYEAEIQAIEAAYQKRETSHE